MTDSKIIDTRNTAFGAMQIGLQSIGAEKFELEDVDNEGLIQIIYIAEDAIVVFGSVPNHPATDYRYLHIETYRRDKNGVEKLVGSLDLQFDTEIGSWYDYPKIVAFLKRLAEIAPDANFAKNVRSRTE